MDIATFWRRYTTPASAVDDVSTHDLEMATADYRWRGERFRSAKRRFVEAVKIKPHSARSRLCYLLTDLTETQMQEAAMRIRILRQALSE